MKNILFLLLIMLLSINLFSQDSPFNRGVNLSNWFQTGSPTEIQFTKYTKKDFENIKSLGADVIRLPINLHSMTLGAPDYELDPLFLYFLDEVVDWVEELELHILIDNHTFDPAVSTEPNIAEVLVPVWKNMAEHFKGHSKYIYYEILNEPHGIDDDDWNSIQLSVINTIRKIDSVHTIVVGPAGWNSYSNLQYMPEYEDDNLLYTFHFYDPFLFTHQGASWSDPSLVPLSGVPFPYNASGMPSVPPELQGTWIEFALNDYQNEGTISRVRELIDIAAAFKEERNVPIFCGEFGVYIPNANNNDRILWYNIVRSYLELQGIAWTSWDYHGGFGIFKNTGYGLFEHDLNTNLVAALGFNVPPQSELTIQPDSIGFGIYTDFIQQNVISSGNSGGVINFYNKDSYDGKFCISWSNPTQYSSIAFDFIPLKDLSYLKTNHYYVGFWIRGNNPSSKFEIRFLDTKENENDHPWRMSYTVDNSKVNFNDEWQYVQIPFSSFAETGSWDNAWYPAQGLFDWSAVETFEIVDEFGQLSSSQLWFDNIVMFDPTSTNVEDEKLVTEFELFQNYPNPFNPSTTIQFNLPERGFVNLRVYDKLGQEVAKLINQELAPGDHSVQFGNSKIATGMYIYSLDVNGKLRAVKKMLMLK